MIGATVSSSREISAADVRRAHEKRLRDAGDRGFARSQELVPQDRGTLMQSGFPAEKRNNDTFVFGYSASYADDVEFGTEPHWVPIEPLKEWAERIGKSQSFAYAVQQKIAREGQNQQPYLRPGANEAQDFLATRGLDRYL